jgi:PadR family transcriptional regulator PadR
MAGVPELLILRLLSDREMYGYELARAIRVMSEDTLSRDEGVLYPALHALKARKLLRSRTARVAGRQRVYYTLAPAGRRRLEVLAREWFRIRTSLECILGGHGHG